MRPGPPRPVTQTDADGFFFLETDTSTPTWMDSMVWHSADIKLCICSTMLSSRNRAILSDQESFKVFRPFQRHPPLQPGLYGRMPARLSAQSGQIGWTA